MVVMLMMLLVISFTSATGLVTQQNYTNASWRERTLEAQYAHRAGLATAMARLTEDPSWAPTEAAPYKEYLDADQRVGFRVWLDGINLSSATPTTSISGVDLEKGQASLRVIAMVNGKDITSGFGGAESTTLMVRPSLDFRHNILQPDPGVTLALAKAPANLLSYNSASAPAPYLGLPAAPPAANQRASIRSLGDITLGATTVYGQVVLPTVSLLNASAGSYNSELREDDSYLPRKFAPPDTSGGLSSIDLTSPVPAGHYGATNIPPGQKLTLKRGAEYFIEDVYGADNVIVEVVGAPADGPAVLYTHTFWVGASSKVNLPSSASPIPSDLQIYCVPMVGCDIPTFQLGESSQAACVVAGHNLRMTMFPDSKLFGAAIASDLDLGNGAEVHYDEALLTQPFKGVTEWVLVSQGML